MEVNITEKRRIKRATAAIRDNAIRINIPRHWSKKDKDEAIRILTRKVQTQQAREEKILGQFTPDQLITIRDRQELTGFVNRINRETFNAPLKKVRIGTARYSRVAQVNLKSGIMTVSRFCLRNVPEAALRYLIVHELAHFYERNHGQRFWALVARYVPDYKRQIKVMNAFHSKAVWEEEHQPAGASGTSGLPELADKSEMPEPETPKKTSLFEQLSLFSRLFPGNA